MNIICHKIRYIYPTPAYFLQRLLHFQLPVVEKYASAEEETLRDFVT
jgi:hypothetical protein